MKILMNSRSRAKTVSDVVKKSQADYTTTDLWTLARSDDPFIQAQAVVAKTCPLEIYEYLLDLNNSFIVSEIISSIYTPAEILDEIVKKPHISERRKFHVIRNPNVSTDTLQYLIDNDTSDLVVSEANKKLTIIQNFGEHK